MREIKRKAMAKINLGLDVLARRPDGYHELRMLMQSISLCDELTLAVSASAGISLELLPFGEGFGWELLPTDGSNLAVQAADLLMRENGVRQGLSIRLKKRIPVAAGLAGGSADAAAVLTGVNELFQLGYSQEELMQRALRLGADVPYCLLGGTALAEGIGERLTPLPQAPKAYVVLVTPPVAVSTGFVYDHLQLQDQMRHPDLDGQVRAILQGDLFRLAGAMGNVLEQVSVPLHPVIGTIKEKMSRRGALGAQMSGSGPTVFGLFDTAEKAEKAYAGFRNETRAEHVFLAEFT